MRQPHAADENLSRHADWRWLEIRVKNIDLSVGNGTSNGNIAESRGTLNFVTSDVRSYFGRPVKIDQSCVWQLFTKLTSQVERQRLTTTNAVTQIGEQLSEVIVAFKDGAQERRHQNQTRHSVGRHGFDKELGIFDSVVRHDYERNALQQWSKNLPGRIGKAE